MAFDYTNLYPDTSGNGGYTKSWNYTSVVDNVAACNTVGYFNKVATRLGIGDNIVVAQVDAFDRTRTTLLDFGTLFVTSISGGVVTTSNEIALLATTSYADAGDAANAAAIALKANTASPTFTGTPAAPTAAVDTNTTQLATTAMVLAQAASATPLINGVAAVGASTRFARGDHVHPTDTTRQATLTAGQLPGTATNDSATAGNVGEYIESVIASGSAVALTTTTAKTITSISLTAGDWDVDAISYVLPAATTSVTRYIGSISGTTNTLDTTAGKFADVTIPATVNGGTSFSSSIPNYRLSLSGTTTVFLVALASFTVSTCGAWGIIRARRVR